MEQAEKVYTKLAELGITYEVVAHPPAWTTADADGYIEGKAGVRTKTLLLCNNRATAYYLFITDGAKRVDMKKLGAILEVKGLRFCSEERLAAKLSLFPGAVSPFGLLNNAERDVQVYIDKVCLDIAADCGGIVTFHPNDNTKTVFLSTDGLFKFMDHLGCIVRVIEV